MWYAGRTDWRVLFSGLDAKDTQQIAQELAAAGIAYQMTADGSGIEVGADEVDKARVEIATKGMPQSGRMGIELFDKPNWLGSEFDEKVNYQRALEGELEHTIGTIAVVRSARVHLVLPKDSLFGEGQEAAKASVVLQLRRSLLPTEQAGAIRSLVAGAVERLSPEDVTLVDADGRLNLSAPGQGAVAADEERALSDKLVEMLEPTAGDGNVRATVTVAYDEGSEEKTDEVVDPSQVAALTLHKSEQTTGPRARAEGVPGTASNTPGAAAPGSAQAAGKAAGSGAAGSGGAASGAAVPPLLQAPGGAAQSGALPVYPQSGVQSAGETVTEESGSYAVTRHTLHSEQGPGRVRRVTAAVVVNDRMTIEEAGKGAHAVWKPRSPDEMQRLEQLARAAVGFEGSRGDQVVIENVSFSSNQPEPGPAGMERWMDQADTVMHNQPGVLRALSIMILGALLVMTVVKPVSRQMIAAMSQTQAALPSGAGRAQPGSGGRGVGTNAFGRTGGSSAPGITAEVRPTTEAQIAHDHVAEQIRKEPAQSTRLLESWINAPLEEED